MKFLFPALAALFLCSCAQQKFVAPSVQPTRAAITSAQEHTVKVREHVVKATERATTAKAKVVQLEKNLATQPENLKLAVEVHGELDALTQSLLDATNELDQTKESLADAQGKLTTAEGKINQLAADANRVIEAAARQKTKYHRLKFAACAIGAGLAGWLLIKFKFALAFLGPYAIAVMIGGPAIIFAGLWLLL
jgi:uncharacterized phage infection (PIP) family protein YhgE